jgi:MFS family permease
LRRHYFRSLRRSHGSPARHDDQHHRVRRADILDRLPAPYAAIGQASLVLLILLRFIGRVFMGGEYTSNNTLAHEMVPKDQRGFVGGILQGAYPIGFFFVSVVTSILMVTTTPDQYLLWGWRIAFVVGAVVAFLFLLYYLSVPESSLWTASEKSSAPLKDVVSGPHLRNLVQIFIMMLGFWFGAQSLIGVMPGVLIHKLNGRATWLPTVC